MKKTSILAVALLATSALTGCKSCDWLTQGSWWPGSKPAVVQPGCYVQQPYCPPVTTDCCAPDEGYVVPPTLPGPGS